jgi:hypothetical protein
MIRNIVSNIPYSAKLQDNNVANPWGLVILNKDLWIANNKS